MRIKLSEDEATYLKDQLDMWIEGYADIDDDNMPTEVILELLHNRETAEKIRERIWRRGRRRRKRTYTGTF